MMHVYLKTLAYKKLKNENNFSSQIINIRGVEVPYFIIGDSAYHLQRFLLKPFPHNSSLSTKKPSTTVYLEQEL